MTVCPTSRPFHDFLSEPYLRVHVGKGCQATGFSLTLDDEGE